jgi:hypothetical protein
MSWTPIHHATPDKPEVIKLARILNLSTDDILGKLVRFWIWVDVNSVDGVVDAVDADVDVYMRLQGFADALKKVGWMIFDEENKKKKPPTLEEAAGKTEQARNLKSERQARYREQKRLQEASTKRLHVDGVVDGVVDDCRRLQTSLPLIREEKRREEKNILSDSEKKSVTRFVKPALAEIADFIGTLDNCYIADRMKEAESFFDFYESKGWVVGKSGMKDWKAAARNWVRNSDKFKGKIPVQKKELREIWDAI